MTLKIPLMTILPICPKLLCILAVSDDKKFGKSTKAARMKKIKQIIMMASILSMTVSALSQDTTNIQTINAKENDGMLFLPVIYYTPETGLAGGAQGLYFFTMGSRYGSTHPSSVPVGFEYTQKGQMYCEVQPEISFPDNAYQVKVKIGFRKFPSTFYGIGNNTLETNAEQYTPQKVWGDVSVQKRVVSYLSVGISASYNRYRILAAEENGMIARRTVSGAAGGCINGAGVYGSWDSRNESFFPSSGENASVLIGAFHPILGSDYEFLRYRIDLRHYSYFTADQVLAVQALFVAQTGTVPIQALATYGGKDLLRGYAEGRNCENDLMAIQAEYRMLPVYWRFGLSFFAGVGEVAHDLGSFSSAELKPSAGFGIRYQLFETEKISLRLDFGWGRGTSGFYITAGEAF
jgi:outer membrane protein assembly factor BamA